MKYPDLATVPRLNVILRDGVSEADIEWIHSKVREGAGALSANPRTLRTIADDLFALGHNALAHQVLFDARELELRGL